VVVAGTVLCPGGAVAVLTEAVLVVAGWDAVPVLAVVVLAWWCELPHAASKIPQPSAGRNADRPR
jgi:hypothetical protein